jgi:hypothetical protein
MFTHKQAALAALMGLGLIGCGGATKVDEPVGPDSTRSDAGAEVDAGAAMSTSGGRGGGRGGAGGPTAGQGGAGGGTSGMMAADAAAPVGGAGGSKVDAPIEVAADGGEVKADAGPDGAGPGDSDGATADAADASPPSDVSAMPACGNRTIDPGEECDDGSFNLKDNWAPVLPVPGHSFCSACKKVTHFCGDKTVDKGFEQCDPPKPAQSGVKGCSDKCQDLPALAGRCGDGVVTPPETCDNGAANMDDATPHAPTPTDPKAPPCRKTACTIIPFCGDGSVGQGEKCDNGKNNVGMDYVAAGPKAPDKNICHSGTCELVGYCGDDKKNGPEACDGKDTPAGQTCTAKCQLKVVTAKTALPVSVSNAQCAGSCVDKVKKGEAVNVSCKDSLPSVIDFGKLEGAPEGDDVTLTLAGDAAGGTITCGANVAVPASHKLPKACWGNNQAVKITITNPAATGCLMLTTAKLDYKS